MSGTFVLSRDGVMGNSDDIVLPSAGVPAYSGTVVVTGGGTDTLNNQVRLPASIQPGNYHIGTTLTMLDGTDLNASNNSTISATPLLTIPGPPVEQTLLGTAGDDTFIITVDHSTSDVRHLIVLNHNQQSWIVTDVELDLLTIDAGDGNDRIDMRGAEATLRVRAVGSDGNDTIWGGPGNDTMLGGAGDDVVLGYDGDDRLEGGEDDDTLQGGEGADLLNGNGSADRIWGGGGKDRLNGHGGRDRLYGEGDADRLYGYSGNDLFDGGSSNDRMYGGAGADYFNGGNGDDFFAARDSETDTFLLGGSGIDTAEVDDDDVRGQIEIFR